MPLCPRIVAALLFTGAIAVPHLAAQPAISPNGIVNSASFAPALSVGGAIAQGSIFSIFGSQLGPATGAQPTAFPLSSTLGGASVKVIQGTAAVDAIPLYSSAGLINAIMPSNAPTGKVSVQVTFNGAKSNLAPVLVVVNAPGIYTATGAGLGPGIVQNFAPSGIPPINSASATAMPGQIVILWLTGLGPVKAPDNTAPPTGNLPYPVEVWVGGIPISNIAYSGRTPCCSGVDEIVFTLPANVPSGCFVPVTARVAGSAVSNTVTMAIDGQGAACSDAANPISGPFTRVGRVGTVALMRETLHSDTGTVSDRTIDHAVAAFRAPGVKTFMFNSALAVPPAGSCTVYAGTGDYSGSVGQFSFPNAVLDAGTLTLTGSAGTQNFQKTSADAVNIYSTAPGTSTSLPPSTGIAPLYLDPGTFRIDGGGGADVGGFSASIAIPASPLNWTNRDAIQTIDRTQPLTLNWSGSASAVVIEGVNYDAPTNSSVKFQCLAPAGASAFTVPPWILANMPASQAVDTNSTATFGLIFLTAPVGFTASGLDAAALLATFSQGKFVKIR